MGWGPQPMPEAFSLGYPRLRPASAGVWHVVKYIFTSRGQSAHRCRSGRGHERDLFCRNRIPKAPERPAPIVPVHFAGGSVSLTVCQRIDDLGRSSWTHRRAERVRS